MARRKRKEEEPHWSPPEFDEVEYMRREIVGAKASTVVIAWSIVGALVSYGILIVGLHWALAFLLGLFAFAGLYYVMPFLGIRTHAYTRKDWVGHGAIYFFSWLAFWILLLNVPFGDFTNPTIHSVLVGTFNDVANPGPGAGTVACVVPTEPTVDFGGTTNTTILLVFRATDNIGVTSVQVAVGGIGPVTAERVAGQPHACANAGGFYPTDTFVAKIDISGMSAFAVSIAAFDARGHRADAALTIAT